MTPKAQALIDERQRIAHARSAKVLTLRKEGWVLREIAKEMGVSVERVRQLEARGHRVAFFRSPEGIAELERQQVEEQAARAAQARSDRARAAYRARHPVMDPIVHAHALQQLWRQFIEPHGAWRRPLVGPYRPLHDWLDWRGSAGVTYRNVPGQMVPEWRVSA